MLDKEERFSIAELILSMFFQVLNVLQRTASQVAALDIGYQPGVGKVLQAGPQVVYLLGADGGVVTRDQLPKGATVIYQGMLFAGCNMGLIDKE